MFALIRASILASVALVFGLFWVQNRVIMSDTVSLVLNLAVVRIEFMPLRVDIIVGAAFAIGFMLAYVLGLVPRMKSHLKVRKLERVLKKSGSEAADLPAVTTPQTVANATADEATAATSLQPKADAPQ